MIKREIVRRMAKKKLQKEHLTENFEQNYSYSLWSWLALIHLLSWNDGKYDKGEEWRVVAYIHLNDKVSNRRTRNSSTAVLVFLRSAIPICLM